MSYFVHLPGLRVLKLRTTLTRRGYAPRGALQNAFGLTRRCIVDLDHLAACRALRRWTSQLPAALRPIGRLAPSPYNSSKFGLRAIDRVGQRCGLKVGTGEEVRAAVRTQSRHWRRSTLRYNITSSSRYSPSRRYLATTWELHSIQVYNY